MMSFLQARPIIANNVLFTRGGTNRYCYWEANRSPLSVQNNLMFDCPTAYIAHYVGVTGNCQGGTYICNTTYCAFGAAAVPENTSTIFMKWKSACAGTSRNKDASTRDLIAVFVFMGLPHCRRQTPLLVLWLR